ncbi:hypothetical protein [Faecalibaculum rodentium]|uniref:hypothetical protein n=5 Tax=Faecalibaculum rodentium TaxID=1702221 RepID=UPI0025B76B14|nr:hypothetical protein [Faecalibaculum rodentium]
MGSRQDTDACSVVTKMNHETRAVIDKVYEHIEKKSFSSVQKMKRDLEVMKYNTDLEWFNCALIAQAELIHNPVFAFPFHVWEQIFPDANIQPSDPPGDGQIMLLVPRFYITSCSLDFDLIPAFFQDALSIRNLQYSRASKAEYNAKKYHLKRYKLVLPKNWQRKLVNLYLEKMPFYDSKHTSEASFYRTVLLLCFHQELMMDDVPDLKLDVIPPSRRIEVYQNIHLAISQFHKAVSQYGRKKVAVEGEKLLERVKIPNTVFQGEDVFRRLDKKEKSSGRDK